MSQTPKKKPETTYLELREDLLFEMLNKSLDPELARDYQVTGLAKIASNRYVVRLERKLTFGLEELEP